MAELQSVHTNLKKAKCPEDVFGGPKDGSAINTAYRQLVAIVHPDHFHSDPAQLKIANEAFTRLSHLREDAERKVKAGTYGNRKAKPPVAKEPFRPVAIEVKGKKFILTDQLESGDICDIFTCVVTNGNNTELPAVFKIVQEGRDNDLLENEAKVLGKLFPEKQKDESFYRFFPRILDSFVIRGPGSQRRVNVLPWFHEHRSLAEVMRVFPDGIDFRDMVWMFNRILYGTGGAHMKHVIHGAIIPPHVLIHPVEHGAKLVDWAYAVELETEDEKKKKTRKKASIYDHIVDDSFLTVPHIKAISSDYQDYYPPEVFEKETPTSATDIYMAAKCAVALVGGDVSTDKMPDSVPKAIQQFFKGCLHKTPSKRPQDAWDTHEELDNLLKRTVGKRKYRPFPMPARERVTN